MATPIGRPTGRSIGKTLAETVGTEDPAHPAIKAHLEALSGATVRYVVDWEGNV